MSYRQRSGRTDSGLGVEQTPARRQSSVISCEDLDFQESLPLETRQPMIRTPLLSCPWANADGSTSEKSPAGQDRAGGGSHSWSRPRHRRRTREAGATVYCTGRSSRGSLATPGRPETIEETAELVTAAGGPSVAVRVDHTDPAQVKNLTARIRRPAPGLGHPGQRRVGRRSAH